MAAANAERVRTFRRILWIPLAAHVALLLLGGLRRLSLGAGPALPPDLLPRSLRLLLSAALALAAFRRIEDAARRGRSAKSEETATDVALVAAAVHVLGGDSDRGWWVGAVAPASLAARAGRAGLGALRFFRPSRGGG